MTERQNPNGLPASDPGSVDRLANRALRMVANSAGRAGPGRRDQNIAELADAATNADRETCLSLMQQMIEAGVPREVIADDYIPTIARQMGDAWCVDEMSFAAVTIGVSRLQSLLRDLGPEWRADSAADPRSGAMLIVVALEEYHTLGAMVLAGRLRRAGLSVQLQIGASLDELRRTLHAAAFDAIMISASRGESLESLRLLVEAIQTATSSQTPIVIGGSIVDGNADDIKARTGADFVTNDAGEALEHCGLRTPIRIDAQRAPET